MARAPKPVLPRQQGVVVPLPYPLGGVNEDDAFAKQPGGTTPDALNCRSFDPVEDRARGGSRPGVVKFHEDPPTPA